MGGQAQLVLYSLSSYCNSAHCPLLLALVAPSMPQHAHSTSKAIPTPLAPSHHEESEERQQQMEEVQPCHFLQFANLLPAAAKPRLGHGSMALPTHPDSKALPGSPVPAPSRSSAQRRQDSSQGIPVTVKLCVFQCS